MTGQFKHTKAMFSCIKPSITRDIKDTIFTQFFNLTMPEDGVALFKIITTFTTVASLQLSMSSFKKISNFNPFNFKLSIPIINSKLIRLFIQATNSSRTLRDSENIQHVLNVYMKSYSRKRGCNGLTTKSTLSRKEISRYARISWIWLPWSTIRV